MKSLILITLQRQPMCMRRDATLYLTLLSNYRVGGLSPNLCPISYSELLLFPHISPINPPNATCLSDTRAGSRVASFPHGLGMRLDQKRSRPVHELRIQVVMIHRCNHGVTADTGVNRPSGLSEDSAILSCGDTYISTNTGLRERPSSLIKHWNYSQYCR